MTADFSQSAREAYLIGQFAFWAGDYSFAQQQYAAASRKDATAQRIVQDSIHDDLLAEKIEHPDDLLAFVAARRLARIEERKSDIEIASREFLGESQTLQIQPLILESTMLRGAVWQINERDFSMKAYVKALKSGKRVLTNAKAAVRQRAGTRLSPAPEPADEQIHSTDLFKWEEAGEIFLSVSVSGLMFIEVSAFWGMPNLPLSFEPARERLQSVLDELSE